MMLSARYFFQWIISFASTASISAATLGFLILGFRIYDAVTDPMAGHISDKLTKIPRVRIMNYSVPIFALGLILCFLPNPEMQASTKWILEFLGMTLFFTGYTFYCIPYWGLVGDYAGPDINLSRTLSNLLGFGLLIATAIGFLASPALVSKFGYLNGAIIITMFSCCLMLLPNLCKLPAERVATVAAEKGLFREIFSSLLQTFKQKNFLAVCILFVGSQMSLTIMTASAPFLVSKLLNGKTSDIAFLMGPMIGVAIPSFLLSQKLSKLWGWEKSVYRASILLACLYALTSLIGISIIGSPLLTASFIFSFSGIPIAVLLGLEAEAVSFCAMAENQGNKISTYFGAINFLIKTFNGIALMLTGILTDFSNQIGSNNPIRALPIIAGSCLVLSLVVSLLIKRLASAQTSKTSRSKTAMTSA